VINEAFVNRLIGIENREAVIVLGRSNQE